jgi:hypothetical protein
LGVRPETELDRVSGFHAAKPLKRFSDQALLRYGEHCYHKPPPDFLTGSRIMVREITGKTLIRADTDERHAPNQALIIFRSKDPGHPIRPQSHRS